MHEFHAALAIAGGLVLLLGIISKSLKSGLVSQPMLAVGLGVLAGPEVTGIIAPADWGGTAQVMRVATEVTLAIGLMGTALRLGHGEIRLLWRPVGVLLTLGMLGMWAASSLVAALWLPIGLWTALLIGAAVTPTDPIVATTVVTGPLARKHLPKGLRASLSFESGANDGLAFLLVMLPLFMLQYAPLEAGGRWLLEGLVIGVLLAALLGAALGGVAALALSWAKRSGRIERHSMLSYTVALSLTTVGLAELLRADALFAVFLAGLVFNLASDISQQHEEENIQEAVGKLFTAPIFLLFGAALPWAGWIAWGWPLLGFAAAILLLRRLPVMLALWPLLRRDYAAHDMAFLGWFGPIGIAALFYAADIWRTTGQDTAWILVSAVVLASILAHGLSAAPLTRAYGRAASAPASQGLATREAGLTEGEGGTNRPAREA